MKLTEMVILAYPNPNKNYIHASVQSICTCLSQLVYDREEKKEVEKPIYFLSHKLSETLIIEKEAYTTHYVL